MSKIDFVWFDSDPFTGINITVDDKSVVRNHSVKCWSEFQYFLEKHEAPKTLDDAKALYDKFEET